MKIIKKAYKVWHDGMLNDNPHLGYSMDDLPLTYADTPGEAKTLAKEPYNFELYGGEHKYTDLKVRRAYGGDIVLHNNIEKKRWLVKLELMEEKRVNERRANVEKFDDDSCFYIQNGYVGNSVMWWAKNGSGYTTDIEKAQLYTKQEVLDKFVGGREEDIIWESKHVLNNIKKHVDAQYLSRGYCC